MYNRIMKQRIIAAVLSFCLALTALWINYIPPRAAMQELGDPLDAPLLRGFAPATVEDGVLLRSMQSTASIRLPLADGRGAHTVALRLRAERAATPLTVTANTASTQVVATPELRTYRLLLPGHASRNLDLDLAASRPIAIDQVTAIGRGGAPPGSDLLALLLIALLPTLLIGLTIRLPLDWSLLITALLLLGIAFLPPPERRALLVFGPLAAVVLATAALIPICRAQPTLTLIVLGGATLRGYALGWGSGWAFHPAEQALLDGTARGVLPTLSRWSAEVCAWIVGDAGWATPWGAVLLGRAWSALAGTALIAASYGLARLALRPRWALLAAAFVAVAPMLVQSSHVASSAQVGALALLALLWAWTRLAIADDRWPLVVLGGAVMAVSVVVPAGLIVLCALPVALLIRRGVTQWLPYGVITAALIVGMGVWGSLSESTGNSLISGSWFAPVHAATITTAAVTSPGVPPYLHALFNLLLWGVGPLLMQLGLFGWVVGVVLSLQSAQYRVALPLLIGMGAYWAIVGRGPQVEIELLIAFAPLLCITAALLLQTFALRLPFRFGQRTVRLLAGTAFAIALASSIGLINVYRAPDSRIAASRWLLARATRTSTVLRDHSVADRLPLGAGSAFTSSDLPLPGTTERAIESYSAAIIAADFVVLGVDRADVNTEQLAGRDPLAACYYAALFSGRLGFEPRATFSGQPRIGAWSLDDRRSDPALRVYDHPSLRVWQRVWTPSPQSLEGMLRCRS